MTSDKDIVIAHGAKAGTIPNRWDRLTPTQFLDLHKLLDLFSKGAISAGVVKAAFVCLAMGWKMERIKGKEAYNNLVTLGDRVTFIFKIEYPDDVFEAFDESEIRPFLRRDPSNSTAAVARYLAKTDYRFVVDACFCAQMVPAVKIGKRTFKAYTINTDFNQLSTSLTTAQYLDVMSLSKGYKDQLPLMAAILYLPGRYDSERAHDLAKVFASLPETTLSAIAFNFTAFINYLFTKTEFKILTAGKKSSSPISIGPSESMYNLTVDGYGDLEEVKQMKLIDFLTICLKKTIDAVKSMSHAKMKITDIASETGFSIHLINEILK